MHLDRIPDPRHPTPITVRLGEPILVAADKWDKVCGRPLRWQSSKTQSNSNCEFTTSTKKFLPIKMPEISRKKWVKTESMLACVADSVVPKWLIAWGMSRLYFASTDYLIIIYRYNQSLFSRCLYSNDNAITADIAIDAHWRSKDILRIIDYIICGQNDSKFKKSDTSRHLQHFTVQHLIIIKLKSWSEY